MRFFLGTHQPHWLKLLSIPLMVSHRTLARYRVLPRAAGIWFKDSSGFTRLFLEGSWDSLPAAQFVAETRRYALEVGNMRPIWRAAIAWPGATPPGASSRYRAAQPTRIARTACTTH